MKSIAIFGLGVLQESLIEQCKILGLKTIGLDPCPDAPSGNKVDVFEIVGGQDFEKTLEVCRKHNVSGVVTAATDKPLVMMARVAQELDLPFYSVESAEWSTDKLLMKERFQQHGIPCAQGIQAQQVEDIEKIQWNYPLIIKPRDNSGSRGVIVVNNLEEATSAITEAMQYTRKGDVLVEEFVEGQEYSIEGLHYGGKTYVIQYTQKRTTDFPYNVELGHIQPADLSENKKREIDGIIEKIALAMQFDNCGSHTELKIDADGKITVIETSPRLGGDYITSKLTPLSTGVNMEQLLLKMSVGEKIAEDEFKPKKNCCSAITFFQLPEGKVESIGNLEELKDIEGVVDYEFDLKPGDTVNRITSSLNRYGWALVKADSIDLITQSLKLINQHLNQSIIIK